MIKAPTATSGVRTAEVDRVGKIAVFMKVSSRSGVSNGCAPMLNDVHLTMNGSKEPSHVPTT
ncbi:MAG: hypothetical protein ACO25P_09520, partial [Ilumatobacteraceae bacterium]